MFVLVFFILLLAHVLCTWYIHSFVHTQKKFAVSNVIWQYCLLCPAVRHTTVVLDKDPSIQLVHYMWHRAVHYTWHRAVHYMWHRAVHYTWHRAVHYTWQRAVHYMWHRAVHYMWHRALTIHSFLHSCIYVLFQFIKHRWGTGWCCVFKTHFRKVSQDPRQITWEIPHISELFK